VSVHEEKRYWKEQENRGYGYERVKLRNLKRKMISFITSNLFKFQNSFFYIFYIF